MSLLDRILLPVDFSERSEGAARFVEALAENNHCEIILAHVATPLNYEFVSMDVAGTVLSDLNADRIEELRYQLDHYLEDELAPYQVRRLLLEGDPARRIVEFAGLNKIGLIVMPTHGYGLFRRFLLGSVTAKVLHDADCPVWTGVHIEQAPARQTIAFRKVLVAVDLCPAQALKAISWGAQFAEKYGAEMAITHACPSIEGHAGEYFDPNWKTHFQEIANDEIMRFQQKLGTNAELILESGDATQTVCRLAETQNADLLVIGRGSAAGVFGRLRANAYAIIRQSPCPVVSV
jgi:nucleotide-binding universal stress UspA family protein